MHWLDWHAVQAWRRRKLLQFDRGDNQQAYCYWSSKWQPQSERWQSEQQLSEWLLSELQLNERQLNEQQLNERQLNERQLNERQLKLISRLPLSRSHCG